MNTSIETKGFLADSLLFISNHKGKLAIISLIVLGTLSYYGFKYRDVLGPIWTQRHAEGRKIFKLYQMSSKIRYPFERGVSGMWSDLKEWTPRASAGILVFVTTGTWYGLSRTINR